MLRIKFSGGRQFSSPKSPTSFSRKTVRRNATKNVKTSIIMKEIIPTYSISNVSRTEATNAQVYYIETQYDAQNASLHLPYRSEYYGIGIILNGNGIIKTNLETYDVVQGSVLAIAPEVVKQWVFRSDDLVALTIFFTKLFLTQYHRNPNYLDSFPFFDTHAKHVCYFSTEQFTFLGRLLENIKVKINSNQPFKNEIIANLINVFLYEYSSLCSEQLFTSTFPQTRSGQIMLEFKKLVSLHFTKQRSVKFYADLLFLSRKHLSETIKNETGKSAGEWIDETVILEAKILLQDPTLNIAQIASQLNFADQSTFGKFFKNLTGLSPVAYRQAL